MDLQELFNVFTSQEIAGALSILGESAAGSKAERIEHLIHSGNPVSELLDAFRAEELRNACSGLGVATGRKAEWLGTLSPRQHVFQSFHARADAGLEFELCPDEPLAVRPPNTSVGNFILLRNALANLAIPVNRLH